LAVIIADTDVLIDYLMDRQPMAEKIAEYCRTETLQTTAISCFELLSGAAEGRRSDNARQLMASLPVLRLDREAATAAASIRQRLEGEGTSIGMADSLIAGIAVVNGLPLLTRNRKHFERVKGLNLIAVDQSTM
jgi:tRNA(fMet)-specific endonuclease VapC